MNTIDYYQKILDAMDQVVVIARYTIHPKSKEEDILIEFVNKAWEPFTGSHVSTIIGKYISETIYNLKSIPWIEIAQIAISNKNLHRQTYYASLLGKWLDISASFLQENLLCVQLFDITELRTNNTRLKEQNHRLSVMSSELSASKVNLKRKLAKIENLNKELEVIAYYDTLTGLPNREKFTQFINEEVHKAILNSSNIAVAFFDVDNLKTINDTLGHDFGDALLQDMTRRIKAFEKQNVATSRFGGDEFLLLLKNFETEEDVTKLLSLIRKELYKPYTIFNTEIKSSVSIGLALFPQDAKTAQELIKNADIAMTEAKNRGKNCINSFHSLLGQTLKQRTLLEQKLFTAWEEKTFELFYQPQFDVVSRELRGFEALIRWRDSELGNVSPEDFIPIAEENRLIIPLGNWVLETACTTLASWKKKYNFSGVMSVNVSPIQLQSQSFLLTLETILQKTLIDPRSLEIEITEGIFVECEDETISILNKIKSLGVGISLDDFGTGYSSLSYLPKIPLTTLKIDKSFIDNITNRSSLEFDITDAIIGLVTKQGINTVAEGIETLEQYEIMKLINCKTVQGFLTGKPCSEKDCDSFFEGPF